MKKLCCTIFLALAAVHFANAAETPTAEAPTPANPPAEPKLELKNKSSFVVEESGRNPFWPIGWKPAAKQTANPDQSAGPEIRESAFTVSSITLDRNPSARFAIINGKIMNEGTVFGLQMGNQVYQITVKSIQDGQVVLQRRDQEIVVPLRRR
ncbi:MAG TPA: hypothetical protein VG095_05260 [Chthoniobacterales bacterium]|nr:hypothetical protein [Chthoniobacterales bacterium]